MKFRRVYHIFILKKQIFSVAMLLENPVLPGISYISSISCIKADSSQFSPLTTLSEQLGPNSWVSSVFIPAFIANIGKHFFLNSEFQINLKHLIL